MDPRPQDYANVVRTNHRQTTGYIAAHAGDCIGIRNDEITKIKRNLVAISYEGLAKFDPKGSWLLGVLLCKGDETASVARWLARLPLAARGRVRFYVVDEPDLLRAFAPWIKADLGDPRVQLVSDFASFHRRFGTDLNDQVYADAAEAQA